MATPTDNAVKFTTAAPEKRAGRYTLGQTVDTTDGGRVGVGVDKRGETALVYEIGHGQSGVPMHAVASAVASGKVIPLAAIVSAFRETGKLDSLAREIAKSKEAGA